jgi:hypothetical protein
MRVKSLAPVDDPSDPLVSNVVASTNASFDREGFHDGTNTRNHQKGVPDGANI